MINLRASLNLSGILLYNIVCRSHSVVGRTPAWSGPNGVNNNQASKRYKQLTNTDIEGEYMG